MKKPQPRCEKRDHGRCSVDLWGKCRSRPWLVVVFEESSQLVLITQSGMKMLAHRPSMTFAQPIVKPFVVGVIETLLLHCPFQVPVDLGHELKVRVPASHGVGGPGPEWLRRDTP